MIENLYDPISMMFKVTRRIISTNRGPELSASPRVSPPVQDHIYNVLSTLAESYRSKMYRIGNSNYSDAHLFKVLYVNPSHITEASPSSGREYGAVEGGSWDTNTTDLTNTAIYTLLSKRFECGQKWESTRAFRDMSRRVHKNEGGELDIEDVRQGFHSIDELYKSIERNGYLSQPELLDQTDSPDIYSKANDGVHPLLNEIIVDIGRDGDFLWRTRGQHRLIISQLLNIEKVPVLVWRRHPQWQTTRENTVGHSNHPDLQPTIEVR